MQPLAEKLSQYDTLDKTIREALQHPMDTEVRRLGLEAVRGVVELLGLDIAVPPVPMILTCPMCNARHIDVGTFAVKLHHTHACQSCGHVWRPAIEPTCGVRFLPGFKDADTRSYCQYSVPFGPGTQTCTCHGVATAAPPGDVAAKAQGEVMIVKHGEGCTEYGPGVSIELTAAEVATAIDAWLVARCIHVSGPRTVTVNGELCESGHIYVDPSGFVIADGVKISGRGGDAGALPKESL